MPETDPPPRRDDPRERDALSQGAAPLERAARSGAEGPHEPGTGPGPESPDDVYRSREARFRRIEKEKARGSLRLSRVRGGLFLLTAVLFFLPAWWGELSLLWAAGVGVGGLLFLGAVAAHRRVRAVEVWAREMAALNRSALCRGAREWKELRVPLAPSALEDDPLARDLQLFGPASLFVLLGTVTSPPGRETLARWLLEPAPPAETTRRQGKVQALVPALDARQAVEWAGGGAAGRAPAPGALMAWADAEPWLARGSALVWVARILPPMLLASFTAWLLGAAWGAVWPFVLIAAVVISWKTSPTIHGVFQRAGAGGSQIEVYRRLLEAVEGLLKEVPVAGALDASPVRALHGLRNWVHMSELRSNGMLYSVVQPLTLWDVHVLQGLERWKRTYGPHLRGWFDTLGEVEALSALAALAHAHPEWTFPRVEESGETDRIVAEALGHPLVPNEARVANDVSVGPRGTFLLVTGSNMSGKSTLLRALGLNVLLAGAGGPVCARSLRMPRVQLASSVQVHDSLEEGVSLFLAELRRIRDVVEGARLHHREATPGLYVVLLDEILRGTNSADRRTAIRRVVAKLRSLGATGLLSTHDLDVAQEPGMTPVHFRETLVPDGHGTRMEFDYRLRPGVASTTNALLLLEAMGIVAEDSEGSSDPASRPRKGGPDPARLPLEDEPHDPGGEG